MRASTFSVVTVAAVLLCGTAAASAGLQDPNLCPDIAPILPSECSPNEDCSAIKCSLNWDNEFVFDVVASLKPCAAAASVGVELDLQKPVSDSWSHVWSLSDSGKFPVPGASIGIAEVDVGLYAEGQIQVDADNARLTMAFDLCGTVFSYQYCGDDLTYYVPSMKPYVPYVVMNHTFSLSSLCGSGSGGGLRSSAASQRVADLQAVENGAECCGESCTGTSQCAEGMFCCPYKHMCMDVTTKSTIGPACDKCKSAPASIFQELVAANGAECCGESCTGTSQCAEGMFCCPYKHMCMDVTTKSTIGPACDKCKSA